MCQIPPLSKTPCYWRFFEWNLSRVIMKLSHETFTIANYLLNSVSLTQNESLKTACLSNLRLAFNSSYNISWILLKMLEWIVFILVFPFHIIWLYYCISFGNKFCYFNIEKKTTLIWCIRIIFLSRKYHTKLSQLQTINWILSA